MIENFGCGVLFSFRKSLFFCCVIVFFGIFIFEKKVGIGWVEEGIVMEFMFC